MRLLMTGATGLLGSELCRALRGCGAIIGWARRVPPGGGPAGGSVTLASVDITDPDAVEKGMRAARPEMVVHAAALSDVDACEEDPEAAMRVNAFGTEAVAKACAATGAALMAISTDYVFDGSLKRPCREEDPPRPVNAYGRSKLEGEVRALRSAPRCMVVRVSGLFGSARANFVSSTAQRLRKGEPVWVVQDQATSPSYTADLAGGIEQLIRRWAKAPEEVLPGKGLHGLFHLANRGGASRREVALLIAGAVGAPESLIRRTTWERLNRPAQRPVDSRLECRRFTQVCGAALRPWEEAVRAFLKDAERQNS